MLFLRSHTRPHTPSRVLLEDVAPHKVDFSWQPVLQQSPSQIDTFRGTCLYQIRSPKTSGECAT